MGYFPNSFLKSSLDNGLVFLFSVCSLDVLLSGFLVTEQGTSDITERLFRVLNDTNNFTQEVNTIIPDINSFRFCFLWFG